MICNNLCKIDMTDTPAMKPESSPDYDIKIGDSTSRHVAHVKFNASQWNRIEKRAEGSDRLVFEAQKRLGSLNPSVFEDTGKRLTISSCGEETYLKHLRPHLVELGLLPVIQVEQIKKKKKGGKGKNKKKKGMTAAEIRTMNKVKIVLAEVESVIGVYRNQKENLGEEEYVTRTKREIQTESAKAFRSRYVETRLVGLMMTANNLMSLEKKDPEAGYELINGSKKAMLSAKYYEKVAPTVLADLQLKIQELTEHFEYTPRQMIHAYPRLFISTDYDWIFPATAVQPYKSQRELMQIMKDNHRDGALIFLKAMIGSGKTTTVAALGQFTHDLRIESQRSKKSGLKMKGPDYSNLQMLFICSVEPVRHQVGYISYNCEFKFGIATIHKSNLRITNHFSTKNDNRYVVISDLVAGLQILKNAHKKGTLNDWLVFLDEPTVGADQKDHPVTQHVSQLLELAPKMMILSSATMPLPDTIPQVIDMYHNNHPDGKIAQVISTETKIGCEIIDHNGNTLAPHTDVTTIQDLILAVEQIHTDPFLGRLYTPPMMYSLYQKMIDLGIEDLVDPDVHFDQPDNQNQNQVQKFALQLLNSLIDTGDD